MKLDLTKIGLLLTIMVISVFGTNQCSKARQYKKLAKSFEIKIQECATHEYEIINYQQEKQKILRDTINDLRSQLEIAEAEALKANKRISYFKAHIKTLTDSISKLSPDSSYRFIRSYFVPGGDDYIITGNEVTGIHTAVVERDECEKLVKAIEAKVVAKDKSIEIERQLNKFTSDELFRCSDENVLLSNNVANLKTEKKILKKKARNRGLLAVASWGLLVLVAL